MCFSENVKIKQKCYFTPYLYYNVKSQERRIQQSFKIMWTYLVNIIQHGIEIERKIPQYMNTVIKLL